MANARELEQAVRRGDLEAVRRLLDRGVDVNEASEEQEWTPLCFAAGRGDVALVRLLVERGADVFKTGRDMRTPYKIALAASHLEAARALADAEEAAGGDTGEVSSRQGRKRAYCKAYPAEALAGHLAPGTSGVVFVHQDLSVTRSAWHGRDVLIAGDDPTWRRFCLDGLGFRVPSDYDLVPSRAPAPGGPADPAPSRSP